MYVYNRIALGYIMKRLYGQAMRSNELMWISFGRSHKYMLCSDNSTKRDNKSIAACSDDSSSSSRQSLANIFTHRVIYEHTLAAAGYCASVCFMLIERFPYYNIISLCVCTYVVRILFDISACSDCCAVYDITMMQSSSSRPKFLLLLFGFRWIMLPYFLHFHSVDSFVWPGHHAISANSVRLKTKHCQDECWQPSLTHERYWIFEY